MIVKESEKTEESNEGKSVSDVLVVEKSKPVLNQSENIVEKDLDEIRTVEDVTITPNW